MGSILLLIQLEILLRVSGGAINNCLIPDGNNSCSCCKSGYRGPACSDFCQHCLTRNVPGEECTYYCETGYYGRTCDEDCPHNCADGNNGPHLCKTKYGMPICVKCIPGYYGKLCDQLCDENCLDRTCYHTNGKCLSCSTNEFYGDHCRLPCSQGCVSGRCNRTGHCTDGCKIGFYGERCGSTCGSNCKQGTCTSHGYQAYNCTEGCHGGYWGISCLKKCPNHCTECEQQNGTCTSCMDNYFQDTETLACVKENVKEVKPAESDVLNLVIAVVVVIVVVILSIIIVVILIKWRHRHRNPPGTSEIECGLLENEHTAQPGNDQVNNKAYTDQKVKQIANNVRDTVTCRPTVGIIFGFGLERLANGLEDEEIINYEHIEGFPVSKMNRLVFGKLGGKDVVVIPGLSHSHEDYSPQKITLPVRTMNFMGVKTLFVITAAGGLNTDFNVGDMMIIKDHLNMSRVARVHPLLGMHDERDGPRFRTMHGTYNNNLRELAKSVAKEMGIANFHEGVYSMISFPSFETATDCKFLHSIDVDAIDPGHRGQVEEKLKNNGHVTISGASREGKTSMVLLPGIN